MAFRFVLNNNTTLGAIRYGTFNFKLEANRILQKYKKNYTQTQAKMMSQQLNQLLDNSINIAEEIAKVMNIKNETNNLQIGKDLKVTSDEFEAAKARMEEFQSKYNNFTKEEKKKIYNSEGASLQRALNSAQNKLTKAKGDLAEYFVDFGLRVRDQLTLDNIETIINTVKPQKTGSVSKARSGKIGSIFYNITSSQKADVILSLREQPETLVGLSVKNYSKIFNKLDLYSSARLMGLLMEWSQAQSQYAFIQSILKGGRDEVSQRGRQILGVQAFMGPSAPRGLNTEAGTAGYFAFFVNGRATVLDLPGYLSYIIEKKPKGLFAIAWSPHLKDIATENDNTLFVNSKFNNASVTISIIGAALQKSTVDEYLDYLK